MSTLIARTAVNAVVPVILLVAAAFLMQGHNIPGGGFIAGVLTAAGVGLLYIVHSMGYVERVLFQHRPAAVLAFDQQLLDSYWLLLSTGLLLAVGTGVVALLYDVPFLTQTFWVLHLPLYDEFHVASAFAFDLGVYLVVVSGLLAVLAVVGEE